MMAEGEDAFEDGEEAFWDQVIQMEEALSANVKPTSNSSHSHHLLPYPTSSSTSHAPPPPPPQQRHYHYPHHDQQQLAPHSVAASAYDVISYSPPRELSQRIPDSDSLQHSPTGPAKCTSSTTAPTFRRTDRDNDQEIERLKRELERASKQLVHLEKECLELKKERDKKDEQLKVVAFKNEEENGRTNHSKSINTGREFQNLAVDHCSISEKIQNGESSKDQIAASTSKATGVQTDIATHKEVQDILNDDRPAWLDLSQKLLAIWDPSGYKNPGSNVISKLLVGRQRNFHILFGLMSLNLPTKITVEFLTDRSSSGLQYIKDCFHTPEAAKVSQLYLVLTKVTEGTALMEALFEPLLDLCRSENVVIVHSSLCILHTFLKLQLELEKDSRRRNNVFVDGICFGNDIFDSCGLESAKDGKLFFMPMGETSHAGYEQVQPGLSNIEMLSKQRRWNRQNALHPKVNWLYLFEEMHHISMKMTEENVIAEAVCIMIVILLRSNPFVDRERFDQKVAFETTSQLLKKDAGLRVKNHALRLLHLLLNCPKLLVTFCCGCKEGECTSAMDDKASASDSSKFNIILQGLADCVASHGSGLQELKLRRNAILVLAFLASSGNPGFEIIVGHRLPRGVNYLMLILQVLVSEIDQETKACEELPEIFQERTFLIREILILLNRLVSSQSYSATVLPVLTNTRDMASLTIDVANRFSRKGETRDWPDGMVKHTRETEIVDLGRVFKKRVFTYLGDDF